MANACEQMLDTLVEMMGPLLNKLDEKLLDRATIMDSEISVEYSHAILPWFIKPMFTHREILNPNRVAIEMDELLQ